MTTRAQKTAKAAPDRKESRTSLLRVRLTAGEEADLLAHAEGDVSDYVRKALKAYKEVFLLTRFLEGDMGRRALSTFECNLLSIVNPGDYMMEGGAELTKPPEDRWKDPYDE